MLLTLTVTIIFKNGFSTSTRLNIRKATPKQNNNNNRLQGWLVIVQVTQNNLTTIFKKTIKKFFFLVFQISVVFVINVMIKKIYERIDRKIKRHN